MILVRVRCRRHPRRVIGIVRTRGHGRFPSYESRAGLRGRRDPLDGDRDSFFMNLRESSETEVKTWCRDCGDGRARVSDLLAAINGRGVVLV